MAKSAHEKQLARARAKRQEEMRADRRRRNAAIIVVVLVFALAASLAVVLAGGGGDGEVADAPAPTPIDQSPGESEPAAGGVACGASEPAAASSEAPTFDAPPEMVIDPATTDYRAVLETSCGTITIDLADDRSPQTVNNFVFLAREGFYDGVTFHRVIDGFVIQGGDPEGTGAGGPGYEFEDELDLAEEQGYDAGTVAMANAGPDTQGSQFFIVLEGGGPALQPLYSIFGQVTEGLDVAERIGDLATDPTDRPTQTVYIESVTIEETPDPDGGPAPAGSEAPAATEGTSPPPGDTQTTEPTPEGTSS